MSLGGMLSGAIDIHALVDQLKHSGGNVVVINPGSAAGAPMAPIGAGGPPPMPHGAGPDMISNGAPPALGGHPDVESPMEDAGEAPGEEDAEEKGMMGAVKAGLKKGPPKAPSKGVGKGPANPQTKPGSAKLPVKKSAPPAVKKEAPKKGK